MGSKGGGHAESTSEGYAAHLQMLECVTQPFPRQRGGKETKCPLLPFGLIHPDVGERRQNTASMLPPGGGAWLGGAGQGRERLAARVQEYSPMKVSTFCRGVLSALR